MEIPIVCPECGSSTYACLEMYQHYALSRGDDGRLVLVQDSDGYHDDGEVRVSCSRCDWSMHNGELVDLPDEVDFYD